jgi:hypothetical protein
MSFATAFSKGLQTAATGHVKRGMLKNLTPSATVKATTARINILERFI